MNNDPVTITMPLNDWRALLDSRRFGKDRDFTVEEHNTRARVYKEVDRVVRGHMRRAAIRDANDRLEALRAS